MHWLVDCCGFANSGEFVLASLAASSLHVTRLYGFRLLPALRRDCRIVDLPLHPRYSVPRKGEAPAKRSLYVPTQTPSFTFLSPHHRGLVVSASVAMESHGWVDALGVILANTFTRKDMCEMRFSAEEREYEEIEVLHKKRKELQSTWRMTDEWQNEKPVEWYETDDPIEHDLLERENKGEYIKNPADQYEISITSASADITARERE
jgi:hypothetical protein